MEGEVAFGARELPWLQHLGDEVRAHMNDIPAQHLQAPGHADVVHERNRSRHDRASRISGRATVRRWRRKRENDQLTVAIEPVEVWMAAISKAIGRHHAIRLGSASVS